MIDIHSHILPETDDGASSWEMAVEMCRMAAADGIQQMVATPHANDEFTFDRQKHQATLNKLQEMAGATPRLTLGCDFHLSYDNVAAALADAAPFVIGNTRYLLVEFSDFAFSRMQWEAMTRLQQVGLLPIITHPERNAMLARNPEQVVKMAEAGCIIQVTASALTGYWGDAPQRAAEWLLEMDAVHVVASDAHDPRRRPPILSQARAVIEEIADEDVALALVQDNPAAILAGEELPYFPTPGE